MFSSRRESRQNNVQGSDSKSTHQVGGKKARFEARQKKEGWIKWIITYKEGVSEGEDRKGTQMQCQS
jgi:hypothetical protein